VRSMECSREQEVVSAILARRWPDGCDEELKMHVEGCDNCGEVAAIASLLHDDHEAARREVHVPASGQVWWRAAVRARLEAAHAAATPITWLHGITGASAAGLALAVIGVVWASVRQGFDWVAGQVLSLNPDTMALAGLLAETVQRSLPFIVAIAGFLLLAPIAVYFALSDD